MKNTLYKMVRRSFFGSRAEVDDFQRATARLRSEKVRLIQERKAESLSNKETIARLRSDKASLRQELKAESLSNREKIARLRSDKARLRQERNAESLSNRELRSEVAKLEAKAEFVRLFSDGGATLEQAAASVSRSLCQLEKYSMDARSFSHALQRCPRTREAGIISFGVYLVMSGLEEAAWEYFARMERATALEAAPVEFFRAAMSVKLASSVEGLSEYFNVCINGSQRDTCVNLLVALAKRRRFSEFKELIERLNEAEIRHPTLEGEAKAQFDWALRFVEERSRAIGNRQADIVFGIMDYKTVDRARTSPNVGDYVQSLAACANLCRFSNLEIIGDTDLPNVLADLQGKIDPMERIAGPDAVVEVVSLDRDASSFRKNDAPVWAVVNGWYMHSAFDGKFDFPFSPEIRPIFVSFHVNRPEFINDLACDYLRKYEPIGCRDWFTVDILRSRGIRAFMSGCLTSTVGMAFPGSVKQDAGTAVVEVPRRRLPELSGPVQEFTQIGEDVRDLSLSDGLRAAYEMLAEYRSFERILTKRLHCYVPCRSIGLNVEFSPANPSDIRYEGLIDISSSQFEDMRTKLKDKLSAVFEVLFSGAPEDDVWRTWQEICADDVAFADEYCERRVQLKPSTVATGETLSMVSKVEIGQVREGEGKPIDVCFAVDENLAGMLQPVLHSILERTKENIRFHVLCRGLSEAFFDEIGDHFPGQNFIFYDFSSVSYGEQLNLLRHTTVSTIDRLMLPELLSDAKKVVYLDVDLTVRCDIAELIGQDLGEHSIAAKKSTSPAWRTGAPILLRVLKLVENEDSRILSRWAFQTGGITFDAFNAGVLVLDLEKMRADDFVNKYLPLVEHYRFNDQDALNFYARGGFAVLDTTFNFIPSQDFCGDPKIVHWAGRLKPWGSMYVPYREEFLQASEARTNP